jgi:hypothetical protein
MLQLAKTSSQGRVLSGRLQNGAMAQNGADIALLLISLRLYVRLMQSLHPCLTTACTGPDI